MVPRSDVVRSDGSMVIKLGSLNVIAREKKETDLRHLFEHRRASFDGELKRAIGIEKFSRKRASISEYKVFGRVSFAKSLDRESDPIDLHLSAR